MRPWPSAMLLGALTTPIVATASPSSLSTSAPYDGGSHTTGNTTVSVMSGPTGSYTFSWALLSGSGITCNSPSAATTSFSGTPPGELTTLSATFRCTVTSVATGQIAHVDVPVSISATRAALNVQPSPGSIGVSHSVGSNYVTSCSVSVLNGTAPYAYNWTTTHGSVSPTFGSSSTTLTVPPGAVGTQTIVDVFCNVTDSASPSRGGTGQSTIVITWTA